MNTSFLFLDQQRQVSDLQSDEIINVFFSGGKQAELYKILSLNTAEMKEAPESDLKAFIYSNRSRPEWFNEEQILKGQLFFKKFALPVMTLLGGLALPYCYAASPGNKALYLSDKMRQSPGKRLLDTADFIISVSTPDNLTENGEGLIQINRIRLIHAIARYHIIKSGKWEMQWGMPVNQEDMAGTNLAFSYLILNGLQKSGYLITKTESESFLALWRYIGYQLHIEETLLPSSFKEAAELEKIIRRRHFKKSEEGLVLTRELIDYYRSMTSGKDSYLLDSQIRYWLGGYVSNCLGLTPQPVKDILVQAINLVKESVNFRTADPGSYNTMISNHTRLKAYWMKGNN